MKRNTSVIGWLRWSMWPIAAGYLWHSSLGPNARQRSDRNARLIGAVIFSILTVYFLGYGLGLYDVPHPEPIARQTQTQSGAQPSH